MSLNGKEKVLYTFSGSSDGALPEGGLIDVHGTLYGTTEYGGGLTGRCKSVYGLGCGTVYAITPQGKEKILHSFQGGSDGARPLAGLIDVNGTLYGTTSWGGGKGCHSKPGGCGTVFSISTSGVEKVMHAFRGGSDGAHPGPGSLIHVNGTLYGTTQGRGNWPDGIGAGNVFTLKP